MQMTDEDIQDMKDQVEAENANSDDEGDDAFEETDVQNITTQSIGESNVGRNSKRK